MKKTAFALLGALLGGALCVGSAWALGYFFGPLYGSEEESTRNFKIFLLAFVMSLLAGGWLGIRQARSYTTPHTN